MKRLSIVFYFAASFIATGVIVFFIILSIRFNSSLWQGYRVLAIPAETNKEIILQAGTAAGITGIISENTIPNRFAFLEAQHYTGFPFTPLEHYQQWFENSAENLCYLYIPYTSLWQFIQFYAMLYISIQNFYLEPPVPYALFQMGISVLLFAYCIVHTKKKALFFAAAVSFLWYSACTRSNLVLTASLLSIFSAAYWIEALGSETTVLWKQLKERIHQNYFMYILPALALVFAVIAGIQSCCFFFLSIILSIAFVFSVYSFLQLWAHDRAKSRLHPQLKILAMHPQSWYRFWNTPYALRTSILTTVLLFISTVFPLFFSWNRLNRTIHTVSIPAPVLSPNRTFTDDSYFSACAMRPVSYLPDLGSYIEDQWYAKTLPYMNVHNPFTPLSKNAQIRYTFFTENPQGALEADEKILYTFNDAFIENLLQAPQLKTVSLEAMLYTQNGFVAAAYKAKKLVTLNTLVTFMITFSALFFPCILIIITRRQ